MVLVCSWSRSCLSRLHRKHPDGETVPEYHRKSQVTTAKPRNLMYQESCFPPLRSALIHISNLHTGSDAVQLQNKI